MHRFFNWFHKSSVAPIESWQLSPEQHARLLELLSDIGLRIVAEARGPVPLTTFGRRMLERLGPQQLRPFGPLTQLQFADGLKAVIREMDHDRLRVISPTDFPGVGYIFNASDPDTWPLRTSR